MSSLAVSCKCGRHSRCPHVAGKVDRNPRVGATAAKRALYQGQAGGLPTTSSLGLSVPLEAEQKTEMSASGARCHALRRRHHMQAGASSVLGGPSPFVWVRPRPNRRSKMIIVPPSWVGRLLGRIRALGKKMPGARFGRIRAKFDRFRANSCQFRATFGWCPPNSDQIVSNSAKFGRFRAKSGRNRAGLTSVEPGQIRADCGMFRAKPGRMHVAHQPRPVCLDRLCAPPEFASRTARPPPAPARHAPQERADHASL